MGCDNYLIREEEVSYDSNTQTEQVIKQLFWDVKSWNVGMKITDHFGVENGSKRLVDIDELMGFCRSCIEEGDDDYVEYEDGAFQYLLEELEKLDPEVKDRSDWYISIDY